MRIPSVHTNGLILKNSPEASVAVSVKRWHVWRNPLEYTALRFIEVLCADLSDTSKSARQIGRRNAHTQRAYDWFNLEELA